MCGIFGIVYSDSITHPERARLKQSAELLSHRGPDGTGIYDGAGIGFAHTRLSLVDLTERSNQPFWDSNRRYCVVYNGEIYNFLELRKSLADRGVTFHTTSDTEVLLQSLIIDGPEKTLPNLEGMFAFAFYDRAERKLLLARDRFGIKPLLLYEDDRKLIFASEVKAMRPWIEIRPNRLQMIRYLMNFGAPVRGYGFFDNIEIVPAGSVIELEVGSRAQTNTFADLPRMIQRSKTDELMELTKKQAVDRVDELLQRSVNRMLLADAPVGALCSGGVDSSLLMAMAAKSHDNLAIFHANVVGRDSEYAAAAALAQHLNLDLLKVDVQDDDFIDMTSDVLYHYEQPFSGHPHSVPFMMVSRLVQDSGVKGVLTGEGADECFLGYSYIAHEPFWDFYKRQVERVESFVQRIPVLGHQLVETENEIPELVTDMMEQFDGALNRKQIREHYVERLGRSPDRNVRTLDLLSNHLRTLLHRNDTMGMGASIEARFPFLDEHLVETAINLPYKFKIRFAPDVWEKDHPFLRDKWVMRQVADRYLPKPLSQREKRGFVVSAFQRMKIENEFFDNSFVSKHFKLGARETALLLDTADPKLKVKLMMLESWGRIFIEGVAPDAVKERLKKHASVSPARN